MRVAALDVGGTKIVGALFDGEQMSARLEMPTPVVDGRADPGAETTREVAARLLEIAGPVDAIGIAVCEYVHAGRITSREVLGWPDGERWVPTGTSRVPVVVGSDVRCGALAELTRGSLADVRSGYFVSWGTGLSGCAVEEGRVVEGAHGRAIALGELVLNGRRLEDHASGRAIADRYREATGLDVVGARGVVELADAGDPVAREVLAGAGEALADAISVVGRLLDPGVVVVGGGLGSADTPAFSALLGRVARHVEHGLPQIQVLHGTVGPDAPLVGAALLAGWGRGAG